MDASNLIFLGLIDGLNVCSISLLALFISVAYSIRASRKSVTLLGSTYIVGAFTAYFLTGIGIMLFWIALPLPSHFIALAGVTVMFLIGGVNVLGYFYPGLPSVNLSSYLGRKSIRFMQGASFPSAAAAGILAGVHNFPCACTGGVYPTFIALIVDVPMRLGYLALYDVIFVLPLIIIVYICSSKAVTLRLRRWHAEKRQKTRLALGVTMLLVGVIILGVIGSEIAI